MRYRPVEPSGFVLLAILYVVTFVFQIVLLRFVATLFVPVSGTADRLTIVADRIDLGASSASGGRTLGERPAPEELKASYPVLTRELSRYPPEALRVIPIRFILLCRRLTLNGEPVGGVTELASGTVVLDIAPSGPIAPELFRFVIHHEIYHGIDMALMQRPGAAESWGRFHSGGRGYGGQAVVEALRLTGVDPGERAETPGFLTHYAMVNAQEDRAVLFAAMMTGPDALRAAAAQDPILRAKVAYLAHWLHDLNPAFDALTSRVGDR